jgi:hypothetical protein
MSASQGSNDEIATEETDAEPSDDHAYKMTLSLNVLNHLGLNLYSNLPAVLSEAVANAWDADATKVEIDIDADAGVMTITDNGIGMTVAEVNDRYLRVGYQRREEDKEYGRSTRKKRPVMGRKGIGKLSLFSIAQTIEVRSKAYRPKPFDESGEPHFAGLVMNVKEIKDQIGDAGAGTYFPKPLPEDDKKPDRGTSLTLRDPKKDLRRTSAFLRRRLARRFAALPEFEIVLDKTPVTLEDRQIHPKVRYAWVFGDAKYVAQVKAMLSKASRVKEVSGKTANGRLVNGWIGSAFESGDLKPQDEGDESSNNIVVVVRGKLAQEDVLGLSEQGGLFTKFLTGELHADFLDEDTKADIATSSRQGIVEDDERFLDLKSFMQDTVRRIGTDWNKFREEDGFSDAKASVPAIDDWIKTFKGDARASARAFISKVNAAAVAPESRKELLMSGVIAFEGMHRRGMLKAIDSTDEANIPALLSAFQSIDDVESAIYYDLVKGRLQVIDKFETLVQGQNKEVVLQKYIFDHLWLLDPGWDKATVPAMEQTVATLIGDKGAPKDRFDIKYRTSGTNHVIVELKKSDRKVDTFELAAQIRKYRVPVLEYLKGIHGADVDLQIVCLVGKDLKDWSDADGRKNSRDMLAPYGARVVLYEKLINDAKQAYQEYLDEHQKLGTVREVLAKIEDALGQTNPTGSAGGGTVSSGASTTAVTPSPAPQN